jgi:beta-xylosidase
MALSLRRKGARLNAVAYAMWAPDCANKDGMYYFYYPAIVKPDSITKRFGMMVGVAVSDRPDGGFVPMTEPIKGIYGIDPCTLIDDDGQAYIYWSGRGMQGARLKPNMLQLTLSRCIREFSRWDERRTFCLQT